MPLRHPLSFLTQTHFLYLEFPVDSLYYIDQKDFKHKTFLEKFTSSYSILHEIFIQNLLVYKNFYYFCKSLLKLS